MTKFFNYYNSLCTGENSPNTFSFDPYMFAIKDMLLLELAQIVFYIEKIDELGSDMSLYRDKVIEFISVLIVNLDFKRESFFIIVEDLYENKSNLQQLYLSLCDEKNITPDKLNFKEFNLSNKESILKALNEHEKNISGFESTLPHNKKILYQIMVNLVLNACNCLIDLKNYGYDFVEAKHEVLKLFNVSNSPSLNESEWIRKIKEFAKCNYKIMKKLDSVISEKYGTPEKTELLFQIKKGKSILVSGYNFLDLEKILRETKNLDINIYTHHEMINAFKYPLFKSYKNLVSHYQRSNNNFALDFASFPGPIFISRTSTAKIDVIRGQIYTSAKYPPFGIGKIENDDFSSIIEYALKSKGFEDESFISNISIGYDNDEIKNKIDEIISLFNRKEISHISIIGLFDKMVESHPYINSFIQKIPDDCFVISFSKSLENEKIWSPLPYFDLSLLYFILEKLIEKIDEPSKNISVFHLDCNSSIIPHLFNLIHLGLSKLFLGSCCPNILNPLIIDGLKNLFSVSEISTPKDDIKQIIK